MRIDPFLLAIVGSVIVAYFFPQIGMQNSSIPLDEIASYGISLIFFFYGLKLSTDDIKSGLSNWKLHLLVQGTTFLIFPAIVLIFYPFVKDTSHELMWLSMLFMAALPSTVSSSVVMVAMAKGNIPSAIFNASISGIIGIIITPLWMTPFIKQTAISYDFTQIYFKLGMEILFPLILGLMLRKYLGALARRNGRSLALFDRFIILLIIYKSFVSSFEDNIFSSTSIQEFAVMSVIVVVLFFLVYEITGFLSNQLGFKREDKITAQYCGTKKSLVHGTVFSEALFGQSSVIGLMLLPLMIFHAFQIFIISVFATKKAEELEGLKSVDNS